MRTLVVAPARVQADAVRPNVSQRLVDRIDAERYEVQKVGERPVAKRGMALESEIGRIDLTEEQQAMPKGFVFDILDVGYWTWGGEYEPPDQGWHDFKAREAAAGHPLGDTWKTLVVKPR